MIKTNYLQSLQGILKEIETEKETIGKAVGLCAETIIKGGLVHFFGSGHSVIPVMDAFPRYGGYVGLHPLMDSRLMWFTAVGSGGAPELIWLERQEGYIRNFLRWHQLKPGDVMVVFSHGGLNAAPVETALYAREKGLKVIAVTCKAHQLKAKATHSTGKKLADAADIVIDTHAPIEDAVVSLKEGQRKIAATSTIATVAITQLLVAETAVLLEERGFKLDPFLSPTAGGTPEGNAEVFQRYEESVRRH